MKDADDSSNSPVSLAGEAKGERTLESSASDALQSSASDALQSSASDALQSSASDALQSSASDALDLDATRAGSRGFPPIPFSKPSLLGLELSYIAEAIKGQHLSGDGPFTKRCHEWFAKNLSSAATRVHPLLTHSCTAALEMSALMINLRPGDEVIMPSFTFVSTANAVALRGAVPVFTEIRPDTLNIDETKIEAAITPRTKAIFVVHYAGVGCEMDSIMDIAKRHNLFVIEDAAQGMMADYKGQALGTIGHLGALSFHETKNIVSGEGGALLINHSTETTAKLGMSSAQFQLQAEIIREKGTNRSQFFRGHVDKYTWVDLGSSYLPSELIAAVLLAQLEMASEITDRRLSLWSQYHERFDRLEKSGRVRRPIVPAHCRSNGHIYYLLTESLDERTRLLSHLKSSGISSVFHYIPLHSSPGGLKYARAHGDLALTTDLSERMIRLPLWTNLAPDELARVTDEVYRFYL